MSLLPFSRKPTASDVLIKGVILTFIGLLMLLAPLFMRPTPFRDVLAQSQVAGWFALVLGLAFIGLDMLRRWRANNKK